MSDGDATLELDDGATRAFPGRVGHPGPRVLDGHERLDLVVAALARLAPSPGL